VGRIDVQGKIGLPGFRYLEETGSTGNVVRGWDGYIDSKPRMLTFRRDVKLRASERIFSYSSVTSPIPPEDIARELAAPSPTSKRSKSSYMNNGDGYNRASQRKKKKKRRADLDEEYEG